MAINATSTPQESRELIEPGTYAARCYQMIHIGTIKETIQGVEKTLNKVRIGWELPTELRVFSEEKGEQPLVISKEYTLSLHEKSNMRKDLKSWRGKDFTPEQALSFDITNLLGAACLITIVHKPSKDGTKTYEEIASITSVPKGMPIPEPILERVVLDYDEWDAFVFDSLPSFIKEKVVTSLEYISMITINNTEDFPEESKEDNDGLPF